MKNFKFQKTGSEKLAVLFMKRARAVQNADEALMFGDIEKFNRYQRRIEELNALIAEERKRIDREGL